MMTTGNAGRRGRLFMFPLLLSALLLTGGAAARADLFRIGWASVDTAAAAPTEGISTVFETESGESFELEGQVIVSIRLVGNHRTDDRAILRELFLQPGERLDGEILQRDVNFLKGLGLFALVTVEPLLVDGGVELRYRFVERGDVRWGFAYPTGEYRDGEVQAGMVYRHRSLHGGRESLFVEGSRGYKTFMRLRVARPWIGSMPIGHYLNFGYLDHEGTDDYGDFFQANGTGGLLLSLDRERPLDHKLVLELSVGQRRFEVDGERVLERMNTIGFGYSRDTRDSFLHPTRGARFHLSFSVADEVIGSSKYQLRTHLDWNGYRPFPGDFVGVLSLESGTRWGELFYKGVSSLGGLNSIRSFSPGHFSGWDGHDTDDGPIGRNHMIFHAELRNSLIPPFTLKLPFLGIADIQTECCVFFDAGALWNGRTALVPSGDTTGDVAFGGGMRLHSPFGDVVRLEFGCDDDGNHCLHLGTGINF